MPLKHLRRKRDGYNTCSFFCAIFVPLHNWPVTLEMRTSTRKASLPIRVTSLLLPKLEFTVEVYWNPTKIKFQNNTFIKSRDFWVSRRSGSLLGCYTAATHRGRRSWRLQDCPAPPWRWRHYDLSKRRHLIGKAGHPVRHELPGDRADAFGC